MSVSSEALCRTRLAKVLSKCVLLDMMKNVNVLVNANCEITFEGEARNKLVRVYLSSCHGANRGNRRFYIYVKSLGLPTETLGKLSRLSLGAK